VAEPVKKMGRPSLGKDTVQFRLRRSTRAELRRVAALDQKTMSEYVEEVLQRHFKARRAKGNDTQ